MARSKAVIKANIIATISSIPIISQLVSNPSQVQYNNNFIDVIARAINLLEQLMDVFKSDVEVLVKNAAVGSNAWLQSKVFEFQYDASNPQVLEVDTTNFTLSYPTVNTSLRIITRCAVKTTPVKTVTVKVAKSNPPTALSGAELTSLQGYLTDLCFAGVRYVATSLDSDKLYVKAKITYNGQYSSVIQSNVILAINDYLANIPFDGSINLLKLTDAIQNVTGVTDVLLQDVALRGDTVPFANKTYLVQGNTTYITNQPTLAGYAVEETTSGQTFSDTLTFIAQ